MRHTQGALFTQKPVNKSQQPAAQLLQTFVARSSKLYSCSIKLFPICFAIENAQQIEHGRSTVFVKYRHLAAPTATLLRKVIPKSHFRSKACHPEEMQGCVKRACSAQLMRDIIT